MSDLDDARARLNAARQEDAAAKTELMRARERRARLGREIDHMSRGGGGAIAERLEQLRAEGGRLDREIDGLAARYGAAVAKHDDRLERFARFDDPANHIERLPDDFPIALLPLRLEVRFKDRELWVRAFPDDALVDSFQPDLSETELADARAYWADCWAAGGDENARKAAWRAFAKRHGSGRAKWIADTYAPHNPGDEPVKAAGEHVLVILPPAPIADPDERRAIAAYWSTVWLSEGRDRETAYRDLENGLGAARAAEVVKGLAPANLQDAAVRPDPSLTVEVAFLDLPVADEQPTTAAAWARGARTWLLPERLVLMGFNGGAETLRVVGNQIPSELQVGPDPSAASEDQLKAGGEDIVIPDKLLWAVDFQEAVRVGMGFVAQLNADQAEVGFDRLFVLGVRLSSDADDGATQLETLIQHHQASRKGFSLLPQGSRTNNTDEASSGYSWWEDVDASYRHFFELDHGDDPDDWRLRRDGAWLAGMLGVDRELLKRSPGYFGTDQAEARAMNLALWPATLGYFMEQMMAPVFSPATIEQTRDFFNRFVLGRGTTPAIRIGRQPYGVLPATAWSRINWFCSGEYEHGAGKDLPRAGYLGRLRQVIDRGAGFWADMAGGVSMVTESAGDPQQRLLDVVGLHPNSVEFHQRYAESFEQFYNRLAFSLGGLTFDAQQVARVLVDAGLATLSQFGWARGSEPYPEILDKFFLRTPNLLHGLLVDAVVSDTTALSVERADGDNYLAWLQRAARSSHDELRRQAGFEHDPPAALLYLMAHHAVDLGYVEAGLKLHLDAGLMTEPEYRLAREEPKFIQVEKARPASGSRWDLLYRVEPVITGDPRQRLGDFIPKVLETASPHLREQIDALDVLKTATTGALERAFVEHLDCCSYRFDAWRSSLVACQLAFMRGDAQNALSRRGVLIGAYGWLEATRPRETAFEPARLEPELAADFERPGDAPLVVDPANDGHIHAPSPDHAVTAAILRNGYLANATLFNPDTLSIELTSERVRLALQAIDGIRNGQPLGALLGYQLERGLYDSGDLFLDRVIYPLRQSFPLAGNRIASTHADGEPITAVEARNVVDGLAFAEHLDDSGQESYPYGLSGLPDLDELTDTTTMTAAEIGAAIDGKVARMRSIADAVADVAMAEGVYQVVKGNYDRAAATTDAFSKGTFPPTPEIVQTPRTGRTLTHRVALHLPGGLDPADPANATPRAKGEPALNAWLAGQLPPMAQVFAAVEYIDPATSADRRLTLSMGDVGLEPIDLFYMVDTGGEREMAGFDDLLIHRASRDATPPRDDAVLRLLYKPDGVAGPTLFEVVPLVRSLRSAVLGARPLQPSDIMLTNEASVESDTGLVARPQKVEAVRDALQASSAELRTIAAELENQVGPAVAGPVATAAAVANIDDWANDYANALHQISPFGLRAASLTTPQERIRPLFGELQSTLVALAQRWQDKLDAFDDALVAYNALPAATPDEERFPPLVAAGRIVSTAVVAPLPAAPNDMATTVTGLRSDLDDALGDLRTLLSGARRLGAFHAAATAFAPRVGAHDQVPLDLAQYPPAILSIADDLRQRAAQAVADVEARLDAATAALADAATAPARQQPDRVSDAMKAILGESFVVLPEFTLPATTLTQWSSSWPARAGLLTHLTTGADATPFPVDDWLHGVARVREKIGHLEAVTMLGPAFGVASPLDLEPLQFPFRAGDGWLALRFPATLPNGDPFVLEGDHLLYTLHMAPGAEIEPTDPARTYCGVLIDEWSELIAADEETTGLVFHYDRPNSEAPQAILLATAPQFTGAWRWDDLVDTLDETLDFARVRAVEPAQVDDTGLARFLPALISAVTLHPLTAMLNLSENNRLSDRLAEVVDE